jgi:hypothetical protein
MPVSPVRKTTRSPLLRSVATVAKRRFSCSSGRAVDVLVDEILQGLALEQAAAAQRPVGKDLLVELLGDLLHGEGVVAGGVQ